MRKEHSPSPFAKGKPEAQRGSDTCLRLHSLKVVKPRFNAQTLPLLHMAPGDIVIHLSV